MKKATLNRSLKILGAGALLLLLSVPTGAESVAEKATSKRLELITYLRALRPMVFNFPCEPIPSCSEGSRSDSDYKKFDRIKLYNKMKRTYQEGLIFYYEGDYINAYTRFLESQAHVTDLLEEMSQVYLDRARDMLRDSIEKREPDNDSDLSVTDISMELGPGSKLRRDFKMERRAGYEERRYDPKMYHYAEHKKKIEDNMRMGYYHLGVAREARLKGLDVDKYLEPHQSLNPRMKKKRIDYYFAAIRYARLAKLNAEFLFQLKYPYDNYALMNPYSRTEKKDDQPGVVPTIANVQMKWDDNPYLFPKNLNPVFDMRVPEKYRADTVDTRNLRYDDEVDVNLLFKHLKNPPTEPIKVEQQGPGNAPASGTGTGTGN